MKEDERASVRPDRRSFLRFAGLGALAGSAALAAGATPEVAEATEAAATSGADAAGYRETAHVKTYYAAARF
ncbi:formate dehydrogenase [Defluviimonas sp. 20V17]|uniref:Formate dehydrogenase region TAT target n=1 Tax=Allgaiera indica TaxID=765699 RepID=A0AAN4ZZL2_9RHOB|nr:twin-arginine translocation signal domain-containing protein [Allgaiera indica]KDB01738.1 formate dehydrogenase [Defluviimonas sp. 20V17]GHE02492.1 hypothetical protein GCM10008024_22170 [Allgaiera indica]SDX29069.1 formate dehydrogenase region TAT target [Allgaiera indica]